MALSNIFREPRRELIEQGFGLLVIGAIGAACLGGGFFSLWLFHPKDPIDRGFIFVFSTFGTLPVGALLWAVFNLAHGIGEDICGAMARVGLDPRPKNRR